MKKYISIAALGLGITATAFAQDDAAAAKEAVEKLAAADTQEEKAPEEPTLKPEEIKAFSSYGIGYQNAMQIASAGLSTEDIDKEAFLKGFIAALGGEDPQYTPEQFNAAMRGLNDIITKREEKIATDNLEKEKKFLEENGKREGVTTTDSGLQYEVLEKGGDKKYEAPKDAPGGMDMQTEFLLTYRGTLIDGTEFDKSPEGEPVPFSLQVVPGFAEALKMMPVGAKWKIYIPSKLGYGEQRNGPLLAPNSTLIFEVELKDITKREAPQGIPGFPGGLPQGHPGTGQ